MNEQVEPWPPAGALIALYMLLGGRFAELFRNPLAHFDDDPISRPVPGLEQCLSVDPQLVIDEYKRLERVAKTMGADSEALGELELMASTKLAGWHGAAADAFRLRITDIKGATFAQQDEVAKLMLQVGGIAALSIEFRKSFAELADATIAAIDTELGNEAKRTTKANLSLLFDLAKDIVALDPKKLLTGTIGIVLGVTKNVIDRSMDEGGEEQVYQNYLNAVDTLVREFQSGCAWIRTQMDENHVDVATGKLQVDDPLPANADVHSPSFNYSDFWCEERSAEDFGPRVDEERAKQAGKPADGDSEISKRLGGAH